MPEGIVISSTVENVSVVVTQLLSDFRVIFDPSIWEYKAFVEYTEFTSKVSDSGTTVSSRSIKNVVASWEQVLAIAPAMATAREQLNAALPALLANP